MVTQGGHKSGPRGRSTVVVPQIFPSVVLHGGLRMFVPQGAPSNWVLQMGLPKVWTYKRGRNVGPIGGCYTVSL